MNTNPPTPTANIPERHADTLRPALYADLDAAGLAAAFAAYSATYNGGWARSVAAAVRAYEEKRWKPGSEKPEEGALVLSGDPDGNFELVIWNGDRWLGDQGSGGPVTFWQHITRPKS